MKITMLIMLSILISCGGGKSSSKLQEENPRPICGDNKALACLPLVDWEIESTTVNFPTHFQVKINDRSLPDTCRTTGFYVVNQRSGKTIIAFPDSYLPKETFKVEIIDRGNDCTNNAIFHTEEAPSYGVTSITIGSRKRYSVSVTLNN